MEILNDNMLTPTEYYRACMSSINPLAAFDAAYLRDDGFYVELIQSPYMKYQTCGLWYWFKNEIVLVLDEGQTMSMVDFKTSVSDFLAQDKKIDEWLIDNPVYKHIATEVGVYSKNPLYKGKPFDVTYIGVK